MIRCSRSPVSSPIPPTRSSNARSALSGSVRSARRAFASYLIASDRRASRIAASNTRMSFDIARPPPVMTSRSHRMAGRTRKRRTTQMSRARQSGRGQLPQAERVLRRIAPLVIVEVGEDVARLRAPSFDPLRPLAERVIFVVRGIAAAGAMKAQVDEVRRHRQMRRPVRRFPCDERDVPPTKEGERLRRKPRRIAWLECVASPARRDHPKESLRALVIELHPWGQLHEHDRGLRAEPSHRPVRPLDAVPLDLQTLDVRDKAIELHRVHEFVRDGPPPLLERLLLRLAVKGIVE